MPDGAPVAQTAPYLVLRLKMRASERPEPCAWAEVVQFLGLLSAKYASHPGGSAHANTHS